MVHAAAGLEADAFAGGGEGRLWARRAASGRQLGRGRANCSELARTHLLDSVGRGASNPAAPHNTLPDLSPGHTNKQGRSGCVACPTFRAITHNTTAHKQATSRLPMFGGAFGGGGSLFGGDPFGQMDRMMAAMFNGNPFFEAHQHMTPQGRVGWTACPWRRAAASGRVPGPSAPAPCDDERWADTLKRCFAHMGVATTCRPRSSTGPGRPWSLRKCTTTLTRRQRQRPAAGSSQSSRSPTMVGRGDGREYVAAGAKRERAEQPRRAAVVGGLCWTCTPCTPGGTNKPVRAHTRAGHPGCRRFPGPGGTAPAHGVQPATKRRVGSSCSFLFRRHARCAGCQRAAARAATRL